MRKLLEIAGYLFILAALLAVIFLQSGWLGFAALPFAVAAYAIWQKAPRSLLWWIGLAVLILIANAIANAHG